MRLYRPTRDGSSGNGWARSGRSAGSSLPAGKSRTVSGRRSHYTDGLIEATNSVGEEYGEVRLRELLASINDSRPAGEFSEPGPQSGETQRKYGLPLLTEGKELNLTR